jgi:hypothetical protein
MSASSCSHREKIPAIVSVSDLTQGLTEDVVDGAGEAIAGASVLVGVLESPPPGIRRAFERRGWRPTRWAGRA